MSAFVKNLSHLFRGGKAQEPDADGQDPFGQRQQRDVAPADLLVRLRQDLRLVIEDVERVGDLVDILAEAVRRVFRAGVFDDLVNAGKLQLQLTEG